MVKDFLHRDLMFWAAYQNEDSAKQDSADVVKLYAAKLKRCRLSYCSKINGVLFDLVMRTHWLISRKSCWVEHDKVYWDLGTLQMDDSVVQKLMQRVSTLQAEQNVSLQNYLIGLTWSQLATWLFASSWSYVWQSCNASHLIACLHRWSKSCLPVCTLFLKHILPASDETFEVKAVVTELSDIQHSKAASTLDSFGKKGGRRLDRESRWMLHWDPLLTKILMRTVAGEGQIRYAHHAEA